MSVCAIAPAPVTARALVPCAPDVPRMHACTCLQVRTFPTSNSFARVRLLSRTCPRARQHSHASSRAPKPFATPVHARARTAAPPAQPIVHPVHPNVHPRVQPSHPTLKPFSDSFLVSRGEARNGLLDPIRVRFLKCMKSVLFY
ncbi:hypothetical protein CDL15_Pgr014600 [Punica granatum]|uniref:Uncharacterized protein n=1 Tax=Punica granatum TaxID=22663 RepID=A0A218XZA4_PUNGR|nr:hypothetical protein CDL15_Pgr014600 [Punica granatum]